MPANSASTAALLLRVTAVRESVKSVNMPVCVDACVAAVDALQSLHLESNTCSAHTCTGRAHSYIFIYMCIRIVTFYIHKHTCQMYLFISIKIIITITLRVIGGR
jgi:hypothetical protein